MTMIRLQEPEDAAQVRAVNELAFGQPAEARVVETLQRTCDDFISLVAVDEEVVVGHILFTPVTIDVGPRRVTGMGLAPMAVTPTHQRRGIGTGLVEHGLALLRARCCPFVVVVGHPTYYPRFGFEPASAHGLRSQWPDVPDEAFMVLILDDQAMAGVAGVAKYRDEFNEVA